MADHQRWGAAIHFLYFSAFHAVKALLFADDLETKTHNGVLTQFSQHFIKRERLPIALGRMYAQLFVSKQKSDYDAYFEVSAEEVMGYFEPVIELIKTIERMIDG